MGERGQLLPGLADGKLTERVREPMAPQLSETHREGEVCTQGSVAQKRQGWGGRFLVSGDKEERMVGVAPEAEAWAWVPGRPCWGNGFDWPSVRQP